MENSPKPHYVLTKQLCFIDRHGTKVSGKCLGILKRIRVKALFLMFLHWSPAHLSMNKTVETAKANSIIKIIQCKNLSKVCRYHLLTNVKHIVI